MTNTATPTFREYGADNFGTFLIINTDYVDYCRLSAITRDVVRTAHLSKVTARELGTSLLAWSGGITCTVEPVEFTSETLLGAALFNPVVEVTDGEAELTLGGVAFTLHAEDRDDLAVRLIAWAGVAL